MNANYNLPFLFFKALMDGKPYAMAQIAGNGGFPALGGVVYFYDTPTGGVLVYAEVGGLPDYMNRAESSFFGMHIHEYGDCSKPFDKTGMHFNPQNLEHPNHAGDLPPLMSNRGYAWMTFYDERLILDDIVGKSVVIHGMRDDFNSQPSGDSGEKIGCGVIQRVF